MIKRTSKTNVKNLLSENKEWSIVDIGGGSNAWPEANTVLDVQDHSHLYPDKRFVQCEGSKTPFKDKEFDFVIASHVTEHVENMDIFISELTRIAKQGYIEVPTPLFDNLVVGNFKEHNWWLYFDDDKNELLYTEKKTKIMEVWFPHQLQSLEPYFLDTMQMSFIWKNSIEYRKIEQEDDGNPVIRMSGVHTSKARRAKQKIVFQNDGTGNMRSL